MELGWLDVCLRINDLEKSLKFYQGLGFRIVEGVIEEGWAVVVSGESRLGLYDARYMGQEKITLNFRGGDVVGVAEELERAGYSFEKPVVSGSEGGASATLRDPDGNLIFLDAAPNETKLV